MRGVVFVLLLLTLSGCLGASNGTEAPVMEAAPTRPMPLAEPEPGPSGSDQDGPAASPSTVDLTIGYGEVDVPTNASLVVLRLPFHVDADGGKGAVRPLVERALYDVYYNNVSFAATGATALVLELEWDSPTYDLDPVLGFPMGCYLLGPDVDRTCMVEGAQAHWLSEDDDGSYWVKDGALGSPDSPVRIAIGRDALASYGCAELCLAVADVLAKDLAVDVTGQLVMSLFYGSDVPEGYSALGK